MSAQARIILWLISVAGVLGVLYGAYGYGRHVEGLERDRTQLAAVRDAVKQANQLAAADHLAALESARRAADLRIAAAERAGRAERGIASHPEYTACALGADDLANLIAAVEGK